MTRLTRAIFRKELIETFRDKRVILGVIVSPLLLTPCLMGAVLFFASQKAMEMQSSVLDIGVYQEAEFPALLEHLEADESIKLRELGSREEAVSAIESLEARAALIIPRDAPEAFRKNETAQLELIFTQANENSGNARNRLHGIIGAFNREQTKSRLAAADLDESFIAPTKLTDTSIAENEAVVGFALSMFLPYLVVMSAAFGGINTAFDLCAGEKERGTMETLLVSPASRYEIVQGKLYTIFVISLVSSICSILGILIAIAFGQNIIETLFGEGFSISYLNLIALVLIVVPLSLLSSAALFLVSSFARNPKEAQAYIFPFVALFIFPAVLSSILGAESPLYTALIPVLNIAMSMKQLLGNVFDLSYFCLALGSSIAYAYVSMRIVTALFQKESILFRS
ncbi:ABC transporter permease [Pelagicoccus sp. SDUM812003]|uniref:ABC transporter permease n=1 Tax=Pelagicoccus sp. SDUM812003 TaxID=3041267 RepID=UPI00280C8417|nr:ABC transporter permease [Pelagicoccus sp. SDUM812003]MDQ8202763.1 ABC transporter permease [Pelagicoccus sp. SDUM812003]